MNRIEAKARNLRKLGGPKRTLGKEFTWLRKCLENRVPFYLTKEEMVKCNRMWAQWKKDPDAPR